jgi:hypothetical protein
VVGIGGNLNVANTLTVSGNATIIGTFAPSNVVATGNVTASFHIGDGSYLTNVKTTADRVYYPTTVTTNGPWTSASSVGNVAALGFTLVGGIGSLVAYGSPTVQGGIYSIVMSPTNSTNATAYTVPTSYVRHTVAAVTGSTNIYQLLVMRDRYAPGVEAWLCNQTSGLPEKRLSASSQSSARQTGLGYTAQPGPNNIDGIQNSMWEWISFSIPATMVANYITGSNTINIALRGAPNHQDTLGNNAILYVGGFAMVTDQYNLGVYNAYQFINGSNDVNAPTGITYATNYEGRAIWSIAPNSNVTVRVPVTDATKNIYFGVVGASGNATYGRNSMGSASFTIQHSTGNVSLGKPQPNVVPPVTKNTLGNFPHATGGFIINSAVYGSKVNTFANSAVSYMNVVITSNEYDTNYGSGFIIESV